MDKQAARSLMESLKTFLEPFEEEHDVKVTVGGGKFDNTTLTVKLELAELTESGEALSRATNDFKRLASSFGLSPDDLGKEFRDGIRSYKIVGLKPRSYRYPVIAESLSDKKKYKFAAESVKMYLNRGKPVVKRPLEEILKDFREVENGLSPENLCCDGEASAAYVRQMSAQLNRQKRALIAELGREPTDKELYPEIYK